MKRICILICLFFIFACASPADKKITPDKEPKDEYLLCMQNALADSDVFQPSFKYDENMPSLIVYPKAKYSILNDEYADAKLREVGEQWKKCYPTDYRPMTLWLYGSAGEIISVIFVTRE